MQGGVLAHRLATGTPRAWNLPVRKCRGVSETEQGAAATTDVRLQDVSAAMKTRI